MAGRSRFRKYPGWSPLHQLTNGNSALEPEHHRAGTILDEPSTASGSSDDSRCGRDRRSPGQVNELRSEQRCGNMKLGPIILLVTASLTLAGEQKAVDVGSFDYRGRSFVNAKAIVVSPNEVKVNGVTIPWDKLNASVQFRLKPMREKVIAQQAKIDLEAQNGEVLVSGRVISVVDGKGVVALCKLGNDSSAPSVTIFLRGVTWLADSESLVLKATPTGEVFKYTSVIGAAKTVRVYDLAR
jgi:hypothetical protein